MKCDTDWERERCQTQMAFSCVALVIPDKYNISPFRFTVNLLCQFSWNPCFAQSLVNVCVSRIYVWFALASGSAHWFHSLIYLKKKKQHPKWSLITQYISPLSLLLQFSSVNPCIFPVLDYWCPLHHVPFCFSDEIALYSSHFWSVYACSYSAAIQMDSLIGRCM